MKIIGNISAFLTGLAMCGCVTLLPLALAQEPLEVSQTQIQVLDISMAEVEAIPQNGRSLVIVESGTEVKQSPAVLLEVTDQPADWVEVHPQENPFPPEVVKAFQEGRYLITGDPGEKFWVSIRGPDQIPVWVEVVIGDQPDIPVDPEKDYADLIKALSQAMPDEPAVAERLASGYEQAIQGAQGMPLADSRRIVGTARAAALAPGFTQPWNPFLQALDAWMDRAEITGTDQYLEAMKVVVQVLRGHSPMGENVTQAEPREVSVLESPPVILNGPLSSPGPEWVWVQECINGVCQGYWRKR